MLAIDKENLRYFCLTVGVWASFLVFGYLQEAVTRGEISGRRFEWTETLVVLQSFTNVLVAGLVLAISGQGFSGGVKWSDWAIVGLGYFGAHACGLAALKHIIYPLQVVIKSCKSIPVMAGEMVFAHSHPSLGKIVSVLQLSLGVGLFMFFSDLAKQSSKKDMQEGTLIYGVLLAVGALVCDAIYGPYQNRICQRHSPSAWHLMFNMNLYQLFFAVFAAVQTDQLNQAFMFITEHWTIIAPRLAGFCLSMTLGNIFIYQMQRHYGALAVAKTTTVRKLVSVSLSVILFGHSLGLFQVLAIVLVFLAPLAEKSIDRHFRVHHQAHATAPAPPAMDATASVGVSRRPATRRTTGARIRSASRKKRT
jgi:UDP-galactose transporter B1